MLTSVAVRHNDIIAVLRGAHMQTFLRCYILCATDDTTITVLDNTIATRQDAQRVQCFKLLARGLGAIV